MLPPHSVPSQLKVLMADGTAMTIVVIMKLDAERRVHAALEHVVAPHDPAEERRCAIIENAIAR